jgi:L-fuconolactonase
MKRIDAHQHFWKYSPAEYGWIGEEMEEIRRDFQPADLKRELEALGVDGSVSVQARQTLQETEWLLALADVNPSIAGVVGWVPLADPHVDAELERFSRHPRFKGVRHVLQSEPAEKMRCANFNRGLARLHQYDLTYDILIHHKQLPAAIELVDRHPEQRFVLNHIAKPAIGRELRHSWQTLMLALAERPNVWCKISGMVTEADYRTWTEEQLTPYLDAVLEAFGARRLMFGSDWPVCLVACSYQRWHRIVRDFVGRLSINEQEAIMGGNAVKAYRL